MCWVMCLERVLIFVYDDNYDDNELYHDIDGSRKYVNAISSLNHSREFLSS